MLDRSSRSFEDDVLWLTDSEWVARRATGPSRRRSRSQRSLLRPRPDPGLAGCAVVGPGLWEQARRLARGLWECTSSSLEPRTTSRCATLWRLTQGEKELLAGHPPGQQPCRLLRMDCSLTGGVLRVLEINTLFSGLASADGVAECVSRLPAIAARLGAMEAELRPLTPCLAMAPGRWFAGPGRAPGPAGVRPHQSRIRIHSCAIGQVGFARRPGCVAGRTRP